MLQGTWETITDEVMYNTKDLQVTDDGFLLNIKGRGPTESIQVFFERETEPGPNDPLTLGKFITCDSFKFMAGTDIGYENFTINGELRLKKHNPPCNCTKVCLMHYVCTGLMDDFAEKDNTWANFVSEIDIGSAIGANDFSLVKNIVKNTLDLSRITNHRIIIRAIPVNNFTGNIKVVQKRLTFRAEDGTYTFSY
jgi:hypothetical protein